MRHSAMCGLLSRAIRVDRSDRTALESRPHRIRTEGGSVTIFTETFLQLVCLIIVNSFGSVLWNEVER